MAEPSVLYLLPGLLCDATVWEPQRAALADALRVRAFPSFLGHDSIGGMAQAVLSEAPERFALAGHSMGARVALEVYRQAPERVERLAIVDTGVHPPKPTEAAARMALVEIAKTRGMRALADVWLPPMVAPNRLSDGALMGPLFAMVERATPEQFDGQVRALLNRPDAEGWLSQIDVPTLVAVGDQDAWSPLEQHEPIAAAINGSRLALINDCGHMAPVEQPEAVTSLLRAWLEV